MEHNPHFSELLRTLNEHGVEFLVVGGYAVMKYAEPSFTKDLDLWIRNSPANAERVYAALRAFGAPLEADEVTVADFASDDLTYQIGRAPLRVDILTRIDGVIFDEAWSRRTPGRLAGIDVHFIGLEDLMRNKKAAGRWRDVQHLKDLGK